MNRKGRIAPKQTLFSYFKPVQTPPLSKGRVSGSRDGGIGSRDRREQENEEPSKMELETTPTRSILGPLDSESDEDNIGRAKVIYLPYMVI